MSTNTELSAPITNPRTITQVWCNIYGDVRTETNKTCDGGLDYHTPITFDVNELQCPLCALRTEYDKGYGKSYHDGYNEGYDEGYDEGYKLGFNDAQEEEREK